MAEEVSSFSNFPEDVQLCILSFLSPAEIANIALTSKRFAPLCRNDSKLWHSLCARQWAPRPKSTSRATTRSPTTSSTAPSPAGTISSASGAAAARAAKGTSPLPRSSSLSGALPFVSGSRVSAVPYVHCR
ncbi:hypothetical protein Tsubulata_043853 [Turnera subulata]|uniref:F-box protein n=1 Tax=Turnera subulata TaxID=218843 RepID=A0A9Q0J8N6_9ROSI|nr:hypothetical protein Tsubulata_043853 [Turnera subulata]